MPGLPDSYRRLASYSMRLAPGSLLYEQGAALDRFFVVLAGDVLFEVVSENGETEEVARAQPGDLVGHIAAISRRPTSASARTERETVVLSIPLARVTEAFRKAPELALRLIYAFADVDLPEEERAPGETAPSRPAVADANVVALPLSVDTASFFTDVATCPVSGTRFEFLRVRTRAVRPAERDSDFRIRYHGVDPTRYGVVVCPVCAYAAYLDDFEAIDEPARAKLWSDREARVAFAGGALAGERDAQDAVTALELALRCYELRGADDGRRAVLQHRRAWLERDAGDETAERAWLVRARESYQRAYERGSGISDESAARMAYLVGDISIRLGDLRQASQWLETVIRIAPKEKASILRTARDRLQDVRQAIRQERAAS